jgi:hypothetical protein
MSARTSAVTLVLACSIAAIAHADSLTWFQVRGGDWTLSPEITSQLQSELRPAIAKLAGDRFKRFYPWQQYKFQFQGQQNDSARYVFIGALCNVDDSGDLTETFVVVLDGGTCFFEVKYDPESQGFYDLVVHGEA